LQTERHILQDWYTMDTNSTSGKMKHRSNSNDVQHGNMPDEQLTACAVSEGGGEWQLLAYNDLPGFLRDNEYLLADHRPRLNSYMACLKSSFRLHTETVNIWSHGAGCALCLFFLAHYLAKPAHEVSGEQKLSMTVYLLGYAFSLGSSVINHMFGCHSQKVANFNSSVDYCGILTALAASYVPWLHAVFYCRPWLAKAYMCPVLVLTICAAYMLVKDQYRRPKYRAIRGGVFICLGMTGLVPGLHYFMSEDLFHMLTFGPWLAMMGACHMTGALFYVSRLPEKLLPGKFNIWGHSHQIMHFFTVGGALAGYHGAALLASFRHQNPHCEMP